MKEARIRVDFNELIEKNLVLLSQSESILDSEGHLVALFEGLNILIYTEDFNAYGDRDDLVASGIVELNRFGGWAASAKWNCRINQDGIRHESEIL